MTVAFLIWFVGMMDIGGEGFLIRQSDTWSDQANASRLIAVFPLFVIQSEHD